MNALPITSKSLMPSLLLSLVLLFGAGSAGTQDDPLLTAPPPKPVRIPAQFEPMQAIIIEWLSNADPVLYTSLAQDVKIIFLVRSNHHTRESVGRFFPEYGISPDCYEFVDIDRNLCPRDHLPWLIFCDQNEPALVYNIPFDHDRSTPQYGPEQGYPVYRSGLHVEGGNFMTDGQGTAISLGRVEFDHQEMGQEFAERLWDFWGVHTYHFIPEGAAYIHTDGAAKLLSPDTIMIPRVPESHAHHGQTEAAVAFLRRQVTCWGTPYKVVRVDSPNTEPYINSLIVNGRVYVPIVGSQADADALASYEAAMPGYEVIGVTYGFPDRTFWLEGFALHCCCLNVADERMLYIEHIPLLDRPPTAEGFPISAKIIAHSQAEFVDGTPIVWWRAGTDPSTAWNSLAMTGVPGLGDDQYLAHIPAQAVGATVQYYLQASDASGRDETHPYIGQAQAYPFTVSTLGANVSAVSAERGGAVEIYINAGLENAGQDYRLVYALSADPDVAETLHETLPETTVFTGFEGQFDGSGAASAQMILPETMEPDWVETTICLSLELPSQQDVVLDSVNIEILE